MTQKNMALSTNKAQEVREALSLSLREAGEIFTGHKGKKAYDTWSRWERTGNWPASADTLFSVILALVLAKKHKTRNCQGALDFVIDMLKPFNE